MPQLIQFILVNPHKPKQNVIYDRTIEADDLHHQTPDQYANGFLKWMFKTRPSSFNHIETWVKPHVVTNTSIDNYVNDPKYQHVNQIKPFFQAAKKLNQKATYYGHTDTFVPILKLAIHSDQKPNQNVVFEHELYPDELNGKTIKNAAKSYVNWVQKKYPGSFKDLKDGLNYHIVYDPSDPDPYAHPYKTVTRLNQLNVYARKWILAANYTKPEKPKIDPDLNDLNDGSDDLEF